MNNTSSFKKGENFEKFVEENIFPKKEYALIHRTNNFEQNKDRYAEDTLFPDFKFRCNKTNQEFYVEAKYRSKFNNREKLNVMSLAQKERFIRIQEIEKKPVFIIIGYQGTPTNPDYLSLIPLNELIFLELYPAFLKKFNIGKENVHSEKLDFDISFKESEKDSTDKKFKKPNNKKRNITIGILSVLIILLFANYQSIFKSIVPPIPEIVRSSSNADSSTLFDYSTKIIGNVMNKGGDGYVVVKAYVNQEGKRYQRSKQIYLLAYETKKFEFIFDEVEFLKKQPTYRVETFRLGSLDD